jgi:outer membrane lipoprotein-sorting protein
MIRTLFLATLIATSSAHGTEQATKPSSELEKEHAKLFSSVQTIEMDFVQTMYRSLRKNKIERRGHAIFAKPSNFFWSFHDKNNMKENFYYNGKKLSHYIQKDNTVTHYPTHSPVSQDLEQVVELVLDAQTLFKRYDATNVKTGPEFTEVTLVPKGAHHTPIKSIDVKVSATKKYIQEVKINYEEGNYTHFSFLNPKVGPVKPETFIFSNPGKVIEKKIG